MFIFHVAHGQAFASSWSAKERSLKDSALHFSQAPSPDHPFHKPLLPSSMVADAVYGLLVQGFVPSPPPSIPPHFLRSSSHSSKVGGTTPFQTTPFSARHPGPQPSQLQLSSSLLIAQCLLPQPGPSAPVPGPSPFLLRPVVGRTDQWTAHSWGFESYWARLVSQQVWANSSCMEDQHLWTNTVALPSQLAHAGPHLGLGPPTPVKLDIQLGRSTKVSGSKQIPPPFNFTFIEDLE